MNALTNVARRDQASGQYRSERESDAVGDIRTVEVHLLARFHEMLWRGRWLFLPVQNRPRRCIAEQTKARVHSLQISSWTRRG